MFLSFPCVDNSHNALARTLSQDVLSSVDTLPDWTNPSRTVFDVTSTYHSTDFQIVYGVDARVVPASDGQINFGNPPLLPTTHLEIYGGVLFAVVTVMEQRDGPRRLHDFDDGDCVDKQ